MQHKLLANIATMTMFHGVQLIVYHGENRAGVQCLVKLTFPDFLAALCYYSLPLLLKSTAIF